MLQYLSWLAPSMFESKRTYRWLNAGSDGLSASSPKEIKQGVNWVTHPFRMLP
jgi:hypothetical protein